MKTKMADSAVEWTGPEQPEGSLSVLDFGHDDHYSLTDAVMTARREQRKLWIPAGHYSIRQCSCGVAWVPVLHE